jgi:hypothetical protein
MLWQAETNFYFRMASGHFGPPPPAYMAVPIVMQLRTNRPSPGAAPALRKFLVSRDVGAVVQAPRWTGGWTPILRRLGLKGVRAGGVIVYRVPALWLTPATGR